MGQFSWIAQDSKESIKSVKGYKTTVHMVNQLDGTIYTESDYEGYGVFGGKDYFVLLAEMNKDLVEGNTVNWDSDLLHSKINWDDEKVLRDVGIELAYSGGGSVDSGLKYNVVYPLLLEDISKWESYKGTAPESDPNQGWICNY